MSEAERSGALVWDLPVRVMHWTLVLAVAGAWASQKLPGDWFRYHVWCGYTVVVTASTRLIWGFVGTRHARFADFVKPPGAVLGYLRSLLNGSPSEPAGHNPLGALMVLLLLGALLAQALTGLFANDEIQNAGPLFGYVTGARSNLLTGIHEKIAYLMLAAIAIHVCAALAYLVLRHENLIGPMITGRKSVSKVPPEEVIRTSRTWLALLIAAVVATGLAIVVRTAPECGVTSLRTSRGSPCRPCRRHRPQA
jgi:cytochrome b